MNLVGPDPISECGYFVFPGANVRCSHPGDKAWLQDCNMGIRKDLTEIAARIQSSDSFHSGDRNVTT